MTTDELEVSNYGRDSRFKPGWYVGVMLVIDGIAAVVVLVAVLVNA